MWLGRPCRCPMRFKKLHCSPRGKKKEFLKISLTWHSLISLFCYYPSLKEDVTLYFNISEFPLHNDTLCQVWLKLAKWFWRRRKCEKFTTTTPPMPLPTEKLTWAFVSDELKTWSKLTYHCSYCIKLISYGFCDYAYNPHSIKLDFVMEIFSHLCPVVIWLWVGKIWKHYISWPNLNIQQ